VISVQPLHSSRLLPLYGLPFLSGLHFSLSLHLLILRSNLDFPLVFPKLSGSTEPPHSLFLSRLRHLPLILGSLVQTFDLPSFLCSSSFINGFYSDRSAFPLVVPSGRQIVFFPSSIFSKHPYLNFWKLEVLLSFQNVSFHDDFLPSIYSPG